MVGINPEAAPNAAHNRRQGRFLKKYIAMAAGVIISLFLLWFSISKTNVAQISEILSSARIIFVLPFLVALFSFYWLKSSRWKTLLSSAATLDTSDLFPPVMIGYAGSAFMPMQLGEVVRAYIASTRFAIPFSVSVGSIAIERVFDLLVVLGGLGLLLTVGLEVPDRIVSAGYIIATLSLGAVTFITIVLAKTELAIKVCRKLLKWIPTALLDRIIQQIELAIAGIAGIRQWRQIGRVVVSSIVQWLLMGLCIGLSLEAFDISVPYPVVFLVLIATIVSISVPSGPGFIGNIQFAFLVALQPFGVSPAEALAASIFYHIVAYVSVVVVGSFFLYRSGFTFRKISRDAESIQPQIAAPGAESE